MKKLIILGLLTIIFYIGYACADVASELQIRLNKINSFHANFTQNVIDADGDLIQEGKGQIWIKRPNLFNFHLVAPDESWLISDGTNIWFYNPLIKQVTVTLLNQAKSDIPFFILMTRNNSQNWNHYQISQKDNSFLLTVTKNNKNLKCFSITVQPDGTIQQFTAVEQDGQISSYKFEDQQHNYIDDSKFTFYLPQGVTIDDQRSRK